MFTRGSRVNVTLVDAEPAGMVCIVPMVHATYSPRQIGSAIETLQHSVSQSVLAVHTVAITAQGSRVRDVTARQGRGGGSQWTHIQIGRQLVTMRFGAEFGYDPLAH